MVREAEARAEKERAHRESRLAEAAKLRRQEMAARTGDLLPQVMRARGVRSLGTLGGHLSFHELSLLASALNPEVADEQFIESVQSLRRTVEGMRDGTHALPALPPPILSAVAGRTTALAECEGEHRGRSDAFAAADRVACRDAAESAFQGAMGDAPASWRSDYVDDYRNTPRIVDLRVGRPTWSEESGSFRFAISPRGVYGRKTCGAYRTNWDWALDLGPLEWRDEAVLWPMEEAEARRRASELELATRIQVAVVAGAFLEEEPCDEPPEKRSDSRPIVPLHPLAYRFCATKGGFQLAITRCYDWQLL